MELAKCDLAANSGNLSRKSKMGIHAICEKRLSALSADSWGLGYTWTLE
jgi:hypothetical protein